MNHSFILGYVQKCFFITFQTIAHTTQDIGDFLQRYERIWVIISVLSNPNTTESHKLLKEMWKYVINPSPYVQNCCPGMVTVVYMGGQVGVEEVLCSIKQQTQINSISSFLLLSLFCFAFLFVCVFCRCCISIQNEFISLAH